MRILFLDDSYHRHNALNQRTTSMIVDHAYSADEAISFLEEKANVYDLIFLDHDLGEEAEGLMLDNEKDGRYVVKKIVSDHKGINATIVIHSLNSTAAKEMASALNLGGFENVKVVPFAWKLFEVNKDGISFNKDC